MPRRLRSLLAFGIAVGLAATAMPASARTSTVAKPRVRMMVLGDSVMVDGYPGVAAAADATGRIRPFNNSFAGVGLTTEPWRKRYRAAIIERRPDVVVEMLGGFDLAAAHDDPLGYAATVRAAMRLLSENGRTLIWIGMLPADPEFVDDGLRRGLNEILQAEADALPRRVRYVDPDPIFAGPDGAVATFLPGPDGTPVRIRKVDGAHLCPDGAALLGLTIIDALRDRFDLPTHRPRPNGAWVRGTWRNDPVYTESKSFDARTLELTSDVCPPSA